MQFDTIESPTAQSLALLKSVDPQKDRVRRKFSVAYFPLFGSGDEFAGHAMRARWYAPYVEGQCEAVVFGLVEGLKKGDPPPSMARIEAGDSHFEFPAPSKAYAEAVRDAHVILVWKTLSAAERKELIDLIGDRRLVFVPTNDLNEKEYGNYCKLMWRLLSREGRDALLVESQQRFVKVARPLRQSSRSAAVLGTGPSIDLAPNFDFSDLNVIACNTIIQSDALLDHVKPKFVCAGDVVSHFGVSHYADKFRSDLVKVLSERDIYLFTTAQFGYLFRLHHPELSERVIFCHQTSQSPVFNLFSQWELPQLDSTLNIHMLPIAASIAREIFILGCDGQSPHESKNEDFWAHSSAAQYHDLVDSGHECHPTFKIHRAKNILKGFVDGTEQTLSQGERTHGKRYISLAPSYTPCIGRRLAGADAFRRRMKPLEGLAGAGAE